MGSQNAQREVEKKRFGPAFCVFCERWGDIKETIVLHLDRKSHGFKGPIHLKKTQHLGTIFFVLFTFWDVFWKALNGLKPWEGEGHHCHLILQTLPGFVQKHKSQRTLCTGKGKKGISTFLAFQTEKSSYKWNRMLKKDCLFNVFVNITRQKLSILKPIPKRWLYLISFVPNLTSWPFLPNQCIVPAPHTTL